jgi:ATP-binding cassette, subfamily B (MDR/TAP), member 1
MAVIWGITAFFSYSSVFALGFWYGVKLVVEEAHNDNTGNPYNVGDVVSIFFCMYISGVNFNPLSGHFANLTGCRIALAKIMSIIDRRPRKS